MACDFFSHQTLLNNHCDAGTTNSAQIEPVKNK